VRIILLLLLAISGIVSCKKDPNSKFLIPKDKFRDILVDIHMADGYYMLNYNNLLRHNDTVNYYNDILKQYGYKRAYFDSTFKYYSAQTKKFEELYDDVITELNKRQQEMYLLQQYETDSARNLFKKKTRWNLPKDGAREMIPFQIAIKDTGLYSIVVQLRVYNDDQAENPHLTAYFWYKDKTKNGHIDYFPGIAYKNTNRLVVLNSNKRNRNKKVTHIKGWILNHDNINQNFKKHVEVRSIIITKN
jgi:hypothetical protein